jgi:hypothetical protein
MRADQSRRPLPGPVGVALIVVIAMLPACVSTPTLAPPRAVAVTTLPLEPDVGSILPDGEESVYKVKKGFLTVGELTYRVAHVDADGAGLLRLESVSQAAAWLAAFVQIGGTTHSYVDRTTLLPRSYYWITSAKDDPLVRTASFDPAGGRVFASAYKNSCLTTRVIRGQEIHDPVSAMMLVRALDFSRVEGELRLTLVEGCDLHLMTLRCEGTECVDSDGPCAVPARRISLRTDKLDCNGNLVGEPPYNALLMWVGTARPHPILQIEGTVGGTGLKLRLEKRTVSGASPVPAASRPAA